MLCPVLCTCGKSIAAYYEVFIAMRQEIMKEVLEKHPGDVLPHMITTSDDLQPMMGEVLDEMNMHKECCRQILLAHVDFSSFY